VQHQHPLVVDRPGQLDLTVDAQQTFVPRMGTCRDAHRKTEAVVTQHHHAQAVDAGLHAS